MALGIVVFRKGLNCEQWSGAVGKSTKSRGMAKVKRHERVLYSLCLNKLYFGVIFDCVPVKSKTKQDTYPSSLCGV